MQDGPPGTIRGIRDHNIDTEISRRKIEPLHLSHAGKSLLWQMALLSLEGQWHRARLMTHDTL